MVGIITSHSGLRPDAKRYVMAGRGVVVDAAGRGDFTTIQDAVDYLAARETAGLGGGRIWIRDGTYQETVVTKTGHDNLVIEGESWDTIIDGGTDGHAIYASSDVSILELQVKTTGGGGNSYDGIYLDSSQWISIVDHCICLDSDRHGIDLQAWGAVVRGCFLRGCDEDGIRCNGNSSKLSHNSCFYNGANGIGLAGSGDNTCITGNELGSNTSYGIIIGANDENCVVVGNRATANTAGNIQDDSGTSTVTGNDTT